MGRRIFCTGIPHFAISIALERDGEIVAGVIYDPTRDEMFWAEKGAGAYVNEHRLRVSARRGLGDAVIGTGIPFRGRGDPSLLSRCARRGHVGDGRGASARAAALDLAYVAAWAL